MGIFERMRDTVIRENVPSLPEDVDIRTFIYTLIYHPLMVLKDDNFTLFRIIISEMLVNEELRNLYATQILQPTLIGAEDYFQQYAEKMALRPVNARLIVRAISSMILGLIMEHIMGDSTLIDDWDKLPDVLTDLILNGLKNEMGA